MRASTLFVTLGVALLIAAVPAIAKHTDPPNLGSNGPQVCIGLDPLPGDLAAEVIYMREEEKLARDVYLAMYELWQVQIFDNISQAEQKHMDAVLALIECYGLVDPVVDDTPGVFTNPVFTALYTDLVAQGSTTLLDAFMVGALIEELDIVDLQAALALSENADVDRVFENLLCASKNHLRAFARQIDLAGGTYTAQYLPQEEFDAIAASPHEACGAVNSTPKQKRSMLQVQQQFGGSTVQRP